VNEELVIQLRRTVDRLRIMSAAQLERDDRVEQVRALIESMAKLSRPETSVPELAITGLADQLAVIGRECAAIIDADAAEQFADTLRSLRQTL
jgi:hypothetical protein